MHEQIEMQAEEAENLGQRALAEQLRSLTEARLREERERIAQFVVDQAPATATSEDFYELAGRIQAVDYPRGPELQDALDALRRLEAGS